MKLSEFANKQATQNPAYKGMTHEEIMDDLHARQQSQIAKLRRDAKTQRNSKQSPISVEVSTGGNLELKKSVYDPKDKTTLRGSVPLYTNSETMRKLANLMRPLMSATKAMYSANGLITNQPMHEVDANGRPLKGDDNIRRDVNGEIIVNNDPLSQFKLVCAILDNNKQAQKALDTIEKVLEEYPIDKVKNLEVTKSFTKNANARMMQERIDEILATARQIDESLMPIDDSQDGPPGP